MSDYNLIRSDHPSNSKRSDVFIYYISVLPSRVFNTYYLQESISFELKVGDKLCNFSETENKFEKFYSKTTLS